MGRPVGSKNGQHGSSTKPTSSSNSSAKTFIANGRKTTNSSAQKSNSNSVNKTVNGNHTTTTTNNNNDGLPGMCSGGFIDRSQANIPFDIRINGFSSLLNTVKKATPKVKKLIMDECDIILECRVCRSLFRSLPNYLSHKEMYCKNTFNPLANVGYSQFIQNSSNSYDFTYHLDESLLDSVISSTKSPSPPLPNCKINKLGHQNSDMNGTEVEDKRVARLHQIISRIAPVLENTTRTPSAFYSDIVMRKNITSPNDSSTTITSSSSSALDKSNQAVFASNNRRGASLNKQVHINLEPIDSIDPKNGIIFQKRLHHDPSNCGMPNSQEKNKSVIKPNTAVLGPDGKIIMCGDSGTIEKIVNRIVAQVDEKHEEQARQLLELNCPHCSTLFPTRKTLRIHVRAAHRSSPDESQGGGDNSIPVSAIQNSSSISEEAQTSTTTTPVDHPPAKKYKLSTQFNESTDIREVPRRETSPDIVDLKSASTKSYGSISRSIVKSSPPKIMRDVQTIFSTGAKRPIAKRPRGRPKKTFKLHGDKDDEMVNGTNNHLLQSTDLSRRLSVSDSSEGGVEESLRRNKNPSMKPATTFRRNLQHLSASVGSCNFNCHNCSANFRTKSDMTMHQTRCGGVINLALLRRPAEQKKRISILVRHDYLKPNTSGQNTVTDSVNNIRNSSLLGNTSDKTTREKIDWARWKSHQDLNMKNKGFYSTTASASQNRSSFNNNNNKFNSYNENYNHRDDLNNEMDDDMNVELDEENDERSVEEQISGDEMIDETSDDDGLPDDEEKNSNHGNTEESDRDSNVTDSGVSTTSVLLMRNEVKS